MKTRTRGFAMTTVASISSRAVNKPWITVHRERPSLDRNAPTLLAAILRVVSVCFEEFQQRPVRREFFDETGEQPLDFEAGRFDCFAQFVRRIFTNMADLGRRIRVGPFIQEKNLGVVVPVERLGDAGNAANVRSRDQQRTAFAQNPPRFSVL